MANSTESAVPTPSPEHRRVAVGQFERANQVIATGKNYDYAIRLLMTCCRLDPANLTYRQRLRQTERAKYQNNMRGSALAGLTNWPAQLRLKTAVRTKNYIKALEYGEKILSRSPWDMHTQMEMGKAADALGLLDLAVWFLEQARVKQNQDPAVNRALALLYEKRGNFTQAMALWYLVQKAAPRDADAKQKLKDLAVHETIQRGQYEATGQSGAAEAAGAAPAGAAADQPAAARPGLKATAAAGPVDRLAREAGPIKARLEADPTSINARLQLAALYRRADHLAEARAVLQDGLGPTGNAWELAVELADLDVEPFRRDLVLTEEKLRAKPDAPDLVKLAQRLRKEIATRELDIYRQKSDRYPTELSHRYEIGVRLLNLGQVDEAIKELQTARNDPRYRWQALAQLGYCFKARNRWPLAQRNFQEALEALPAADAERRKELLYELAQGSAAAGDLAHAVEVGQELANLDFGYRDIGRLLDEWETAASRQEST
jgi:tetratricopeptide (TPR) repeat protein